MKMLRREDSVCSSSFAGSRGAAAAMGVMYSLAVVGYSTLYSQMTRLEQDGARRGSSCANRTESRSERHYLTSSIAKYLIASGSDSPLSFSKLTRSTRTF